MPRTRQVSHGTTAEYRAGCRCDACRAARQAYDQERYARLRDLRIEQNKAYRAANPDKVRAWSAAQYHRDPAKAKAAALASAAENPAAVKAAQKRYQQSPQGRLAAAQKAARRRGVVTDIWTDDYIALLVGDPCVYCGEPAGTVDHIDPIAKGGTSEWHNLAAACKSCNSSKRDTDLLPFLLKRAS